jgi:hypothetical protein
MIWVVSISERNSGGLDGDVDEEYEEVKSREAR